MPGLNYIEEVDLLEIRSLIKVSAATLVKIFRHYLLNIISLDILSFLDIVSTINLVEGPFTD